MAASAALLGAAPLIIYNLQTGSGTLRLMASSTADSTFYGVSNRAYLSNLGTVLGSDLPSFLNGSWIAGPLGALHINQLALPSLVVSLLVVAWLAIRRRLGYSRKRLALGLIIILAVLLPAPIIVSSLGGVHLALIWPWPQAIIAVAPWGIYDLAVTLLGVLNY